MVYPYNIQTGLAHEGKINIDLLRPSEIVSFRVRLEWSISHPFNEKLSVTFKKEFRHGPNSRVCAHSGKGRDAARRRPVIRAKSLGRGGLPNRLGSARDNIVGRGD